MIKTNKKAVSLMISYVLLITIAIIMSFIVYSYLSYIANVEPVIDCKEGTSLIVEDYSCDSNKGEITLVLRNNGRFNIHGFISTFGGNPEREAITKLFFRNQIALLGYDSKPNGNPPHVPPKFSALLKPGDITNIVFTNIEMESQEIVPFDSIVKLKVQPYIIDEETDLRVPCGAAITKQDINNCFLKKRFPESKLHHDFDTLSENKPQDRVDEAHVDKCLREGECTILYDDSGKVGKAIKFDESVNEDQYRAVRIPSNTMAWMNERDEVSISFWFKGSSTGGADLIKNQDIAKVNGFIVKLKDNKIRFKAAGDNQHNFVICDQPMSSTEWKHIVLTAKEGGAQRIYVNGAYCNENTAGSNKLNKQTLDIGGSKLVGSIDELKMWNIILDEDQVEKLYNSYN